uniref:Uncharacterized protein n=1 Tax=Chlamydomonas euryale TaxID=1486919 RepID=A0A7R9V3C5_9CHLO|mmetsp:Transcript_15739/g.46527  ORF Transcript_15739/g.46527 Transcript_15739/m.46527 type:complete len:153 (+) Transcript_15739:968-1426(+)|eukprot:317930-Chlamydomonas_euryale.AAC.1
MPRQLRPVDNVCELRPRSRVWHCLLTSIVKTNAKAAAPAFQSCSNKIKAQSNARLLNICPERPPQISFAGHGCGFGHNMDDDCSYAQQRKLHALFVGGPAPTVPPLNAEWLLKWYSAFANTDSENEVGHDAAARGAGVEGCGRLPAQTPKRE